MRLSLLILVVAAACNEPAPRSSSSPDAGRAFTLEPPPSAPAPALPPVVGASAENGAALYTKLCASCHASGAATAGRIAPTNLAGPGFLCFSTVGKPPAPADADLDAALDRGVHRSRPELAALGPAARRSILLHVKTFTPRAVQDVLVIPQETPDTPEDRARGRALYLGFGCWRCHGPDGAGDGDLVKNLAWNGKPVGPTLAPLAKPELCGGEPARLFQTIALGMGATPEIMPRHLELAELFSRPKGDPASWTRSLEGHVGADDIARLRAFLAALPERKDVVALPPADRQARGAGLIWSLVHWIRSIG
jgi:mono/diheme cytochrome c family protein